MESWKKNRDLFEGLTREIAREIASHKSLSKDVQGKISDQSAALRLALIKEDSRGIQVSAANLHTTLSENRIQVSRDRQQWLNNTKQDRGRQSDGEMNIAGKGFRSSSYTGSGSTGIVQKGSTPQSQIESKGKITVEPYKTRDSPSQPSPKGSRSAQDTNKRKAENEGPYSSSVTVRHGQGQSQPERESKHLESTSGKPRTTDQLSVGADEIDKLQNEKTELLQYEERIKELKQELDDTRSDLQTKIDTLQDKDRSMEELQQYADDMSSKLQLLQNTATEDKRKDNSQITKLTDDLRDKTDKLDMLKREFDDMSTRYSQLASERLKHGNPDIVDLSDPNRAMKLAERFNDLYNDTWTDAFVAQQGMGISDNDGISYLLYVLQECYKYCEEVACYQFESLTNVLLRPCQDPRQQVKKSSGLAQPRISTSSKKVLRDLRREIMTQNKEEIIQAFLSHMHKQMKTDKDRKRMEVSKMYYQKCVELCWLVVLHDPPLCMKTDVKQGARVDLNYFSVMSKGDKVDQLVWPALLNGEGGGLLAKGVVETVQGAKKKGGK